MNQKIKELANLAAKDIIDGQEVNLQYTNKFAEQLAELIIQEMLQTCEDHPGWTGRMIGEQIKEHFGVDE